MACGKFNFGHASKWDRQQMAKKAAAEAANSSIDEWCEKQNPYGAMIKRELEAKLAEAKANEEWIWVEGYKGTNANMACRDFQFEMHKQFDMSEGADIVDCESGFHLCRDLKDVFGYYKIEDGNRFFRVRALVRKKDYENYGKEYQGTRSRYYPLSIFGPELRDKLAAKSIQFLYELTPEEVFAPLCEERDEYKTWSADVKKLAMERGFYYVRNIEHIKTLVSLGYSDAFAQWLVKNRKYYNTAVAVGSQEDLSMDMKVLMILKG